VIGFLLKKFLYDLWDNFFFIFALNLGFLLFLALGFFLLSSFPAAGVLLFVVFIYWLCVYICGAASVLKDISDYRRPGPLVFFTNIRHAFRPAAVLFAAFTLVFFMLRFTVPIYFKMGNFAGLIAAFFSCWVCLFILGVINFYPAVYYRLGMRSLKSLKKCAIVFFDNPGFCFFSFIFNIILTVLILPFPGCSLLFSDEALRLRLFKYDWLEKQALDRQDDGNEPPRKRVKIPWKELLEEEKEKTGNRSLKSFIFPWKD